MAIDRNRSNETDIEKILRTQERIIALLKSALCQHPPEQLDILETETVKEKYKIIICQECGHILNKIIKQKKNGEDNI